MHVSKSKKQQLAVQYATTYADQYRRADREGDRIFHERLWIKMPCFEDMICMDKAKVYQRISVTEKEL